MDLSTNSEESMRERARRTALDGDGPSEVRRAAEEAVASVEELARVGDAYLARHTEERPYVVLGIAAGIGFVLGGGLAWRAAGPLVNLAGRMAVARVIQGFAADASNGDVLVPGR